jgi:signal transduction histidine kinase
MPGPTQNRFFADLARYARGAVIFITGPWSIRPIGFGVIAAFLNQFSDVRAAVGDGKAPVSAWLASLPVSLAIGVSLGLSFWLVATAIRRCTTLQGKQLRYHTGIFIISATFASIYGFVYGRSLQDAGFNTVRVYLVILSVSIIFGVGEKRVLAQASRAENALAEVDRQRSLLLQADENTRREVADFLHDRVQAGLVVANLELNNISEKLSEQHKAEIRSVVAELEEIRRFDVRDASRLLSPDIAVLGLNHCITELTQRYRNSMKVTLHLDAPTARINPDQELAVYRICEQALLNAALHGKAEHCTIKSAYDSAGNITISIENNGALLSEQRGKTGAGTAVVDAWVSKFNGTWSLINTEEGTVRMSAQLPSQTSQ